MNLIVQIIKGAIIGAGGVLPGVSGGVLAVLFGLYKPLMRFLAHPIKNLKSSLQELWPILLGYVIGYVGIAKVLGAVLEAYETQSLAVFVGMAIGIMPSLFREAGEKGRAKGSFLSLGVVFAAAFTILYVCKYVLAFTIVPNFGWNIFCGFCLALSVIAPGMSFSTLLMPLGLYTPFIDGIGNIDFGVLIPGGVGALLTVILFSRAVSYMMHHHYSVMFHAILGVVVAATIVIVPFAGFASIGSAVINFVCMAAGVACALALDKFNSGVEKA